VSAKLAELARRFPTLRDAEGLDPWDPDIFDSWAASAAPGSGALNAARFILELWNQDAEWKCGAFKATKAVGIWDDAHLAAFRSWVEAPWFP
jgi:hypothetical protein